MNVETGKVYETPEQITRAMERGEKLVPVSEVAARRIAAGRRLQAAEHRADRRRARNRKRDRLQKASRKANRR